MTRKANEMGDMISAEEGVSLYAEAGLSENTFYRHAREKKIRKNLPGDRERGALYSKEDIEKIIVYQRNKTRKRLEAIKKLENSKSETDWFQEHDLPYLLALDYQMYGVSESLDLSISYGWWSKNPKVCRILYNAQDRRDIWGYITMIPMREEIIFSLLRREMHERDIKPEHILIYEEEKEYTIYAASVVVKPEHQGYLRGLIKSIFNYWCDQYPDCRISKIYAYAESEEGWRLIRHLYFAPRYDIGSKVFELNLEQPNPSKMITSFQHCLRDREPSEH